MPLNLSIFSTLFPQHAQDFDLSNLPDSWNGSPVFSGQNPYDDTPPTPVSPTIPNQQVLQTPQTNQPTGWDSVISTPRTDPMFAQPDDSQYAPSGSVDQRVTGIIGNQPPRSQEDIAADTAGWASSAGAPDMTGTDKYGKKVKPPVPVFTAPYANLDPSDPDYGAKDALNKQAQIQFNIAHPVNQDHGWKGILKELASNALYGIGQTPPGASVKQALLLGGVGAGAGLANRSWNERRAVEAALPGATQDVENQHKWAKDRATTADILAKPGDRDAERERKAAHDAVDAQYKSDLATLGATKAANLKEYRHQIVELKQQGVKQTDQRIKLLEDRINNEIKRTDETIRHDTAQEGLGKLREEGRDTRQDKAFGAAATRQDKALGAAADRQDNALKAKQTQFETKFNAKLAQDRAAGQYKKITYVNNIQDAVKRHIMTQDYANKLIEQLPE